MGGHLLRGDIGRDGDVFGSGRNLGGPEAGRKLHGGRDRDRDRAGPLPGGSGPLREHGRPPAPSRAPTCSGNSSPTSDRISDVFPTWAAGGRVSSGGGPGRPSLARPQAPGPARPAPTLAQQQDAHVPLHGAARPCPALPGPARTLRPHSRAQGPARTSASARPRRRSHLRDRPRRPDGATAWSFPGPQSRCDRAVGEASLGQVCRTGQGGSSGVFFGWEGHTGGAQGSLRAGLGTERHPGMASLICSCAKQDPLPIVLCCGPSRFFALASGSHPAVCVGLCETSSSWGWRFQGVPWNVPNSGRCSHQSKRQTFCGSNCICFSCTRRNEGRCPWQPQGPDSHAAVWTSPALRSRTRRWAQPPTPRSRYELRRRAGGQMARTGTAAQCPCEQQSPGRPLTCSPPGATLDLQEVGGPSTIRDK